jgi:uncharacterized protein YecT (DUF1311 family)
MKHLLLLLAFISSSSLVYSQGLPDTTQTAPASLNGDWVDRNLSECLKDINITAPEQMECLAIALQAWEDQLDYTYDLVVSQVDEPTKSSLKVSKTAWVNYKNAQFKFLEQYYGNMQGTMYKQMMLSEKIEVIKKRYAELYNVAQD